MMAFLFFNSEGSWVKAWTGSTSILGLFLGGSIFLSQGYLLEWRTDLKCWVFYFTSRWNSPISEIPYWQYMLPQWGHEALHWHMFAARRALHAKSHRSRYTGFYIAAVLFLLLPHHFFAIAASFFCYCRIIFCKLQWKDIAAPRRTRVTNAMKICRTSLVARYAAPPCVTRYAATYIASTVVSHPIKSIPAVKI